MEAQLESVGRDIQMEAQRREEVRCLSIHVCLPVTLSVSVCVPP